MLALATSLNSALSQSEAANKFKKHFLKDDGILLLFSRICKEPKNAANSSVLLNLRNSFSASNLFFLYAPLFKRL